MKRKHTLGEFGFLKTALTALCMFAVILVNFSCKEPQYIDDVLVNSRVLINVKLNSADPSDLTLAEPALLRVNLNSTWKDIKERATAKLQTKNGAEFGKWTLKNNALEQPIPDNYKFNTNISIYAHTKPRVKITVMTDTGLASVKEGASPIFVKQGSAWQSILPMAEAAVQPNNNHYISGWHKDSSSGIPLKADFTFTQDSIVYASIQAAVPGKIYITVTGDEGINIKSEEVFETAVNAAWASTVKALAESKIEVKKGYKIKEWRLNSANGQLLKDDYVFTASSLVYAVSVKDGNVPSPKKEITITVAGDGNITVKSDNTFKAEKGVLWKTVKAEAEKIASANKGYRISGWTFGAGGAFLTPDSPLNEAVTIIYAVSSPDTSSPDNKVEVIVTGDSGISVNGSGKFKVEQGLKWKNIKAQAQAQITIKKGFTLKEWKNGQSGSVLSENSAVTGNLFEVYAVTQDNNPSPQPKEDVTVIVSGDQFVSLKDPAINSFKVKKGAAWASVKDKALALINFTDGASLKEWKIGNSGGSALSEDTLINSNPFNVFAVTQGGNSGGGSGYTLFFSVHSSMEYGGTISAVIEGSDTDVKSGQTLPAGTKVILTANSKEGVFVEKWYGLKNDEPHYGEYKVRVVMDKPYTVNPKFIKSYHSISLYGRMTFLSYENEQAPERIIIPARIGNIDVLSMQDSEWFFSNEKRKHIYSSIKEIIMADSDICHSKITAIEKFTFQEIHSLKKIHLSRNVKILKEDAFHGCDSLEEVTGAQGISEIHDGVFNSCYKLKKIGDLSSSSRSSSPTLPNLTVIGGRAFSGCSELNIYFKMPSCIKGIGFGAFLDCVRTVVDLTEIQPSDVNELMLYYTCFGNNDRSVSLCNRVLIKKGNNALKKKIIAANYASARIEEVD